MCGCKTEGRTRYNLRIYTLPVHKNKNRNSIPSLPAVKIFTGALDVQCTEAFSFLPQRTNNMERVDNERLGVHPSFERGCILYLDHTS